MYTFIGGVDWKCVIPFEDMKIITLRLNQTEAYELQASPESPCSFDAMTDKLSSLQYCPKPWRIFPRCMDIILTNWLLPF